jgi:nucleotide-binding universal stress UspA family protein
MADRLEPPIFDRIVVGVDGEQGGRDALALAAVLRRAGGGELIAVHVHPPARNLDVSHPGRVEARLAVERLDMLEREIAAAGVHAQAIVVTENSPARALHAVAERHGAQLIVVGACHLTGTERVLAGDDATGTLHGASCAVAVAPAGFASKRRELRLIGVGVDGTPAASAACEVARSLARRAGAAIRAMTVVRLEHPLSLATTWEPRRPDHAPDPREAGRRLLDHLLAGAGVDATGEVAVGTPWKQLASRSADLDLLVLGTRDRGPLPRVLLGSTSTKLVCHIPCALLVTGSVPAGRREGRTVAAPGATPLLSH